MKFLSNIDCLTLMFNFNVDSILVSSMSSLFFRREMKLKKEFD